MIVVAVDWIIIVIILEVLARAAENTVFIGYIRYNLGESSNHMSINTALRRIRSQRITLIFLGEVSSYKAVRS